MAASIIGRPVPLLSVVIPTLNAAGDLPACLNSIQAQECAAGELEIVVADGGSTDRTVGIAEEAGARVVANPHRRAEPGVAVGIAAARSELVTVMAADNRMRGTDFVQKIVEPFSDPTVVAAFPRVVGTEADGLAGRYVNRYSDPFTNFVYGARQTSIDVMVGGSHAAATRILQPTLRQHPLVAVAQGCTLRRRLALTDSPETADDVMTILDLIGRGGRLALVPGAEIEHHHVNGLRSFYVKYRSRVRGSLGGEQGYLRRRRHLSAARRARTLAWPVYSASLVAPMLHGAWRAVRYRDPLALYHPVVNTALLAAVLREMIPAAVRRRRAA